MKIIMKIDISKHPIMTHTKDIADICNPLLHLNINYFGLVHINNNAEVVFINNHPDLANNYLAKKYHHSDILSSEHQFPEYILWDSLHCTGNSKRMLQDASEFGCRQFFSIIEQNIHGKFFYHFASQTSSVSMHQVYLSNLDALKDFIYYFNDTVNSTSQLSRFKQTKVILEDTHRDLELIVDDKRVDLFNIRHQFTTGFANISSNKKNPNIKLSRQQSECLRLLVLGYTMKDIATKMNLSTRTVECYLSNVRKLFNCRNSKELIAAYYTQIQ